MEIKFERYHLQSELLSPLQEFKRISVPTEIRVDPLTKRRSRIITWSLPSTEKFDFTEMASASKGCVFCPENVLHKTPKFIEEVAPEGRLQRGKAIGFPNLFPAGASGSVVVLCEEHFLPLNQFSPQTYEEGLSLSMEIVRRMIRFDPDLRYWQISQNFLLPGGSSILHPHLQVIGDPIPTNEMEWLMEASASYQEKNNTVYWKDLVETEKKLGERFITTQGHIHWFVPFAPIGFNEVCAWVENHPSILTLGEEELAILAKGIVSTLKYYDHKSLNSFNLAFYSIFDESSPLLLLRIISRTPFQPFYLNDCTSFEVLQSELTSNIYPEELCREIRPFFT